MRIVTFCEEDQKLDKSQRERSSAFLDVKNSIRADIGAPSMAKDSGYGNAT